MRERERERERSVFELCVPGCMESAPGLVRCTQCIFPSDGSIPFSIRRIDSIFHPSDVFRFPSDGWIDQSSLCRGRLHQSGATTCHNSNPPQLNSAMSLVIASPPSTRSKRKVKQTTPQVKKQQKSASVPKFIPHVIIKICGGWSSSESTRTELHVPVTAINESEMDILKRADSYHPFGYEGKLSDELAVRYLCAHKWNAYVCEEGWEKLGEGESVIVDLSNDGTPFETESDL